MASVITFPRRAAVQQPSAPAAIHDASAGAPHTSHHDWLLTATCFVAAVGLMTVFIGSLWFAIHRAPGVTPRAVYATGAVR